MTTHLDTVREALNRPFHGGSRVTNCVPHMDMAWHDRPKSCERCMTDMANTINYAIGVNEFLNQQVDDAKVALAALEAQLAATSKPVVSVDECAEKLRSWAWMACQPTGEGFGFIDDNSGEIVQAILDHLGIPHDGQTNPALDGEREGM